MREIKFRAWDKQTREWIYLGFSSMVGIVDGSLRQFYRTDDGIGHKEWPTDYALMQYTGLKDKNGVEIYEGDVVLEHTGEAKPFIHWEVTWLESRWILRARNSDAHDRYLSHSPEYMQPEVIGNIYENPDLLSAPHPEGEES